MSGDARRRLVERAWILMFIVSGFLFAVFAPPLGGIPLSAAAWSLGALDAYVHRRLVGATWLAAAVIFGGMWVSLSVAAAITGADSGLEVFTP